MEIVPEWNCRWQVRWLTLMAVDELVQLQNDKIIIKATG